MSPIPLYNINSTDQGVLNRAKGRVVKKLAKKFSQDVLLQDVDITEGEANDIAEKLVLDLQNLNTLLQQVILLSNITSVVRGATRAGAIINYPSTTSFDNFISVLTNFNTKAQSIFDRLKRISGSFNYISSSNINNINTLLEDTKKEFDDIFKDVDAMQFQVNGVALLSSKQEVLTNIVKDISNLLSVSNDLVDFAIRSYNDKTTSANIQRMVAVDATPRMQLKGGRRSYSVQQSNLATMLI